MLNLDLSALDGLELTAPVAAKSAAGVKISRVPTEGDLIVFSTGAIYPSESLVARYNLEYKPKALVVDALGNETYEEVGNGLDIFESKNWSMIDLPIELLMVAVSAKKEAKVDVWGTCKFDEEGTPVSSVLTQGKVTFAKAQLLGMITSAYGVDWNVTDYVELSLVESRVMVSPTGRYNLPTVVSRGANKGELTEKSRTEVPVFPLVMVKEVKKEGAISPEGLTDVEVLAEPEDMVSETPLASVEATEEEVTDQGFTY